MVQCLRCKGISNFRRLATTALGRIAIYALQCVVTSFQRNQLSIWSGPTTPVEARMEECLPGGDYASIKDDPSKTANPPATWTPIPAGEQAQSEGERSQLAGCCVVSGRVTHMWSRIVCKHLLTLHCCPCSLDPQACPEAMKYRKLPPIPQR